MSNYFGTVTKALGLAGQYFLQQIGYRGKTGSALMIFPYGTHASPKEGSFAQILCNNGDPGSRTAIAWDMNNRPELADGDVAVYLPKTNTLIQLNAADESISITSDATVDVTANDINMTATNDINMVAGNDINMTATNDIDINSDTTMTVNVPTTNWYGDINLGTVFNTGHTLAVLSGEILAQGTTNITHTGSGNIQHTAGFGGGDILMSGVGDIQITGSGDARLFGSSGLIMAGGNISGAGAITSTTVSATGDITAITGFGGINIRTHTHSGGGSGSPNIPS